MAGRWGPLRHYWWLVVALVVLWALSAWLPGSINGLAAFALIVLTGMAAAVMFPAHPLRNGTLGGALACYIGAPIAVAVQTLLGTLEVAQGESVASFWIELPFWLTLFLPIALIGGLIGGAIVLFAGRTTHGTSSS